MAQTGTLGVEGGSPTWSGGLGLGMVSKAQRRTARGASTERDLNSALCCVPRNLEVKFFILPDGVLFLGHSHSA